MVAQNGVADTEQPDQEQESTDRRRRMSTLSGIVLLIALLIVLWLLWTYAQRPATLPETPSVPSAGSTTGVPDVVGLAEDEAVRTLSEAGFSVTVDSASNIAAAPGTVATQDPRGGVSAKEGSVVAIAVVPDNAVDESEAEDDEDARDTSAVTSDLQPREVPGTATVPRLVGLSESAAKRRIRAAGLDPRPMHQPRRDQVGKVYQQDPAPGTKVEEGRKVFILIGKLN